MSAFDALRIKITKWNPLVLRKKVAELETQKRELAAQIEGMLDGLKHQRACLWTANGLIRLESIECIVNSFAKQLMHNKYSNKLLYLKRKKQIKVGFAVVNSAAFNMRDLFTKMLLDELFAPFIIVVPDIIHGDENMFEQMKKTYKDLSSEYPRVYNSYNYELKEFIDYHAQCDIICFANPYDHMTHNFYTIEYMAYKGILTVYTTYGYQVSNWYKHNIEKEGAYKYLWMFFAENRFAHSLLEQNGINSTLLGYCKMDALALAKIEQRTRKRIIIAPHHTIEDWVGGVNFSRFLKYAELFLRLPKLYPDIDFVFRPHPLLLVALAKEHIWGHEKVNQYLQDIESNENMRYDNSANYFDVFANSDALIHDCGSFMAEYLFTEKPACYLLKNTETRKIEFNDFANSCIDQHYQAFNEEDIINFIENVVINGNDYMQKSRVAFVNSELKINYPNVADKILEYIKDRILNH